MSSRSHLYTIFILAMHGGACGGAIRVPVSGRDTGVTDGFVPFKGFEPADVTTGGSTGSADGKAAPSAGSVDAEDANLGGLCGPVLSDAVSWPGSTIAADVAQACDPSRWTIVASTTCGENSDCPGPDPEAFDARAAIDGDPSTRYTSGVSQGSAGPETLTLTFPSSVTTDGLLLETTGGEGPAVITVRYQPPGGGAFQDFSPRVVLGGADRLLIELPVTPILALQITQVGMKTQWWSVDELSIEDCVGTTASAGGPGVEATLPFDVDDHYFATGFMGETAEIASAPCTADAAARTDLGACHGFTYSPADPNSTTAWAGVAWQYPVNNWGAVPGLNIAPGANQVTFCAWGASGGELVDFFAGLGVPVDPVSVRLSNVPLSMTPTRYTLDLRGATYDNGVVGGFGWTINATSVSTTAATFFVSDIQWR
jgi:hypothetical protein